MSLRRVLFHLWPSQQADEAPRPESSNPEEKAELHRRHERLRRQLMLVEAEMEVEQQRHHHRQ